MSVFSRPENCPSISDVVLISGGRLFHANGPATEKLHGPKPVVLVRGTTRSCWPASATCRDCRDRTDHRHEVRSDELVKTLVHQYTNLKVYTLSHQKPVKVVTNGRIMVIIHRVTVDNKKRPTFIFTITLANLDRFHRTWILLPHYLVKVKCPTAQRFIHTCIRCISWTYLHKQQMSELPSMTVFQVLSQLEPCYEGYFAHLLDACFKSLYHCSIDALTRYLTRW